MNEIYESALKNIEKMSDKECWESCSPIQKVKIVIFCNSQKTVEDKLKMVKKLKILPKFFYRRAGARAARLFEKKATLCYIKREHLQF